MNRSRWATRLGLVGLTWLAWALRLVRLGAQNIWSDEDITLDRIAMSTFDLVEQLPVEHAPLYFVTTRWWSLLAGTGDFALRFPSAAASVLLVPLVAALAGCLAGRRAVLPAAILVAVNPFQVWYAQEARMYALLGALGAAALVAACHTSRRPKVGNWAAVGALSAACLYTHYYGGLVVLVIGAWAVADVFLPEQRPRTDGPWQLVLGWVIAALTGLAAFGPWLPRALKVLDFPGWRDPVPVEQVPWINFSSWTGGPTATDQQAQVAAIAYGCLAATGVLAWLVRWLRRTRRRGVAAAGPKAGRPLWGLLLVLAPAAAMAIAAVVVEPDFHPRYFAAVVPGLYVLAAAGAVILPGRVMPAAAAALVALTAVGPLDRLYHEPAVHKQDYQTFVARVEAASGHEDTVLFLDGPSYGITRRYEMEDSPVKIVNLQSSGNQDRSEEALAARMAELAGEYPHLWLATSGASEGVGRDWLATHTYPVHTAGYQDITLTRYFAPRLDPADSLGRAECANGICLAAATTTPAAGEALAVALGWRLEAPIGLAPKVSVRIVAGDQVVAQADRVVLGPEGTMDTWPVEQRIVDRHGLPLDAAPPPDWRLVVVLYRPDDLSALHTWEFPSPDRRDRDTRAGLPVAAPAR